jgi:hypothetical protein
MEHNGQGFALVRLERGSFDHAAQTGLKLEGRHRQLKCESCHSESRMGAARSTIKVKDPNRSFLGLRRNCTACHADRHEGRFGAECTRCHMQDAWKPAPGFNHAQTAFTLTGRHEQVECVQCHGPRPGEDAARFRGLAPNGCASCHIDPHKGGFREAGFRGSCDNCHNTGGWKNNRLSASFEHQSTRFPLLGRHAQVECRNCHKSSDFSRPVPHERCAACHQDPHGGQFANRAAGADCSSCHRETGFKPALFDTATHAKSAFPLEGKHNGLPCANCHAPAGRETVYITGRRTCFSCHADYHAGEFASAPYRNQCSLCHTTAGFEQTTFSLLRHAATRFPLTAKHGAVACGGCHKETQQAERRFHFDERSCNTCHADPHGTQLSCETCHTPEAWRAVRPFDHSSTKFRLQGAHEKAACILCHVPSGQARTVITRAAPRFGDTRASCSGCHAATDPHGGQFGKGRAEDCSSCHVPQSWKPPVFDHDKTRFPLDVAHRNVACDKCHKDLQTMRVYRDTPKECVRCH